MVKQGWKITGTSQYFFVKAVHKKRGEANQSRDDINTWSNTLKNHNWRFENIQQARVSKRHASLPMLTKRLSVAGHLVDFRDQRVQNHQSNGN